MSGLRRSRTPGESVVMLDSARREVPVPGVSKLALRERIASLNAQPVNSHRLVVDGICPVTSSSFCTFAAGPGCAAGWLIGRRV